MQPTQVFASASAASRVSHARAFIDALDRSVEVVVVASTRGAADAFARAGASAHPATVGWHRFSLTQLAARIAASRLAAAGIVPGTALGAEAVAARAGFEALRVGGLTYLAPVVGTPGFPRALARTIADLRAAGVAPARLKPAPRAGPDLGVLLEGVDDQLRAAGAADRAQLFRTATEVVSEGASVLSDRGCVLLDVMVESDVERAFVAQLLRAARHVLVTVPAGDETTRASLERLGLQITTDQPDEATALGCLRTYLFAPGTPRLQPADTSVRLFSAPGESRESLDIARFALEEASRGVRFDEMAILVRSGREYIGLLEHALARAEIPAWFDHGTRRPHPAGRALLALLACADENLSAKRFAEYLSLGQVPELAAPSAGSTVHEGASRPQGAAGPEGAVDSGAARPSRKARRSTLQLGLFDEPVQPADEALSSSPRPSAAAEQVARDAGPLPDAEPDPYAAALEGSLRTPRRWEELLIESQVIAGAERWRRRLDGLANEYTLQLAELRREGEDEGPRGRAVLRDAKRLEGLRSFALPIIEEMSDWPVQAPWSEWLRLLEGLVPRVIRQPLLVLRVVADLRPLAGIGPVGLREVRDVMGERLRTLAVDPPSHPYGRVFVGSPEAVRGRVFRIVFVPGLAERIFPQKLREDPLFDDELRAAVKPELSGRARLVHRERLRLQLAVGAATERLYVSYPRLDTREARPRVPSFYALDVMRAIRGRLPGHEELQREAAALTAATLAWPAPLDPSAAVDDLEHDLAVLKPLLQAPDGTPVKGRAHYLLTLNDRLHRSLTERWKRWRGPWTDADGIVRITDASRDALASQRLTARPYSLSALQRYAACPYQFLLGAIYRIEPFEIPEPLQKLDPLTKGALFHRVQAEFFRELQQAGLLPVRKNTLARALGILDGALTRVGEEEREKLVPAIDRVWHDEMALLRRDLRRWIELMPDGSQDWTPEKFEFSFGLRDDGRDPSSVREPVVIDDRFLLRGAVDLIERHATVKTLRVTDHKTGKCRVGPTLQIGGGAVLQPVLYSLAVERALGERVAQGRLYYCTTDGGFRQQVVDLFDVARSHGIQALEIIDRAIELGFLAAVPAARACTYCDFRPVCGPDEERRLTRKNRRDHLLGDLLALREMP
jgi:ATP-dependent helicase/nuclease subunit B